MKADPLSCVCGEAPHVDPDGLKNHEGKVIGVALYCIDPRCLLHLHAGGRTLPIAVRAWDAVIVSFHGARL